MDIALIASKVHPTIWGVIIGSLLTLFGTFLQGRTALRILLKQKALDNDSNRENRNFDLKKENYLDSLKSMTKLINAFMDFTKPGRDFDNFGKEIQQLFVELCTIDLVAEVRTLEPMHKFQKLYFQTIMELMTEKIPCESLVIDQSTKRNWYNYYSKRIEENIAQINNNQHNGTDSEVDFQAFLSQKYKEYCKERDRYSKELCALADRLLQVELDFKRKAVEKLIVMNQFLTEYIQLARTDLGLAAIPIEFLQVNAFHQNVRETVERTFAAVEQMKKEGKARVDEVE